MHFCKGGGVTLKLTYPGLSRVLVNVWFNLRSLSYLSVVNWIIYIQGWNSGGEEREKEEGENWAGCIQTRTGIFNLYIYFACLSVPL